LEIAVVGVPKTIDNDISYVERSFGFETAVTAAGAAILSAHAEAKGARNSMGLVKLMGRESGFIAAFAAVAYNHVNHCLIPELPFTLDGLLQSLEERLDKKGHAVIVVGEGAGQAVKSTPEILPLCMGAQAFFRQHPVAIPHKIQKFVLRFPRSANFFRFALE
jgi:6-phosphofructokinase 1